MILAHLADLIQTRNHLIVNLWLEAVRNDPRIRSDENLTDKGLTNHVPYIIEEICQLLREGETPVATNTREGRGHVYTRYRQGYRARDLVSEISVLRIILLDELAQGPLAEQTHALKLYVEAARTINCYIDEELRYAISVYTEADKNDPSPEA
jgi:hypothetical protein